MKENENALNNIDKHNVQKLKVVSRKADRMDCGGRQFETAIIRIAFYKGKIQYCM